MSCHPPARQIGPYQSEDGPHNEPTEQLALADLHVKPYAERHIKVYADTTAGAPDAVVCADEAHSAQPGTSAWASFGTRPDVDIAEETAGEEL